MLTVSVQTILTILVDVALNVQRNIENTNAVQILSLVTTGNDNEFKQTHPI